MSLDIQRVVESSVWIKIIATLVVACSCALTLAFIWERPKRTSDWWKLRATALDIGESYQPIIHSGNPGWPEFNFEQKLSRIADAQRMLDPGKN
jgi:hypothetical protein